MNLHKCKNYVQLCKVKLSLFSAFSAITGFLITPVWSEEKLVSLAAGVFFMACGAAALNQYQERDTDALMSRTKDRPVPARNIKPCHAFRFSLLLISLGFFFLFLGVGPAASVLGSCGVLWYNGIYTYLKRKTAFAVIPGGLIGAIPPAIGWVAGGGALSDPRVLALCFFFFMWQVPHFWLLILNYGKEYEEAGLPSLSGIFSRTQLVRITSHWIFATVVSCLFVFFYGLHSRLMFFSLFMASLWFLWQGINLRRGHDENKVNCRAVFKTSNYYMLFVLSLLSFDRFNVFLR